MTTRRKNLKVFVSYSKGDRDFANAVSLNLEQLGASAFDASDVGPGQEIFSQLKQQLVQSDVVVFIVPPHEGAGRWALAELGAAKALNRKIIAVLPDRARYRNGDSLKFLFSHEILDASGMSGGDVAEKILQSAGLSVAA